jgi:hypothetical protein
MSNTDWAVLWFNVGAGEARTFHPSQERALNAACDATWHQRPLRIEGPNGVVIEREAIEQYCKSHPRRP